MFPEKADLETESLIELKAKELLFEKGDRGGDLFLIEEGEVEIFIRVEYSDAVLSSMTKGEIIGIVTCLTSEPRFASCRAKVDTKIRRIPRKKIERVLEGVPDWMHIVLKEFGHRLSQINERYSEAKVHLEKLKKNQASFVFFATQLAGAAAAIGELISRSGEGEKVIIVDDLLNKFELILALPKKDIATIWEIFSDVGLIHETVDAEKKKRVIKLSNAQKLNYFSEFVQKYRRGKFKELESANLTHRETRNLIAMTKVARHMGLDLSAKVQIKVSDIEGLCKKVTNNSFDAKCIQAAVRIKLAELVAGAPELSVAFVPVDLGRTVGCLEAIRRLTALESESNGEKVSSAA